MTDQRIYELAYIFKTALLTARDEGSFDDDWCFYHFPGGCCGDTCELLATFLKGYGVETIYAWGEVGDQSHAWLVVNDDRVNTPEPLHNNIDDTYKQLLKQYGEEYDESITVIRYKARDLTNGLVVDITADQFGEPSVYVGKRNAFYRKHKFCGAHICDGINNMRLNKIYRNISCFLPR